MARLGEPGVHVTTHVGLEGYAGLWLFRRGASCIVSAPPDLLGDLADRLGRRSVAELGDPARVAQLLPESLTLVGPAFHASVAPGCFLPRPDPDVRALGPEDAPRLEQLARACASEEWEAGADVQPGADCFGCFRRGELVALSHLRSLPQDACDPGAITHPAWRGRGCGAAVVSAAVEAAIARDRLVLFQTLVANAPALALARSLGFDPYATHLAARLAG